MPNDFVALKIYCREVWMGVCAATGIFPMTIAEIIVRMSACAARREIDLFISDSVD